MKKILAILSMVAVMFASCEKSNGGGSEEQKPNFPTLQEVTAESGASYDLTFTVDKEWSLALTEESRIYASMTYNGFTDTQCSGEAGEHTVKITMQNGLSSYVEDFVAEVEMTIDKYTQTIAIYTIPHSTYTITGAAPDGMENDVVSTIAQGGHPENGPFAEAPTTYTVSYLSAADAEYGDFIVSHNLDFKYQYEVYAKNDAGEFEILPTKSNEWLEFSSFAYGKKFKLAMHHKSSKAVLTEGVGYEAYVNMVNEEGKTIVSVYYLYNPDAVAEIKTSISLANPEQAAKSGVTFEGSDKTYTLTLASPNLLGADHDAATLKLEGYSDFYGGIGSGTTDLQFHKDLATGLCYLTLADGVDAETLRRNDVLTISGTIKGGGLYEYTINLVLDWIEATSEDDVPEETPQE